MATADDIFRGIISRMRRDYESQAGRVNLPKQILSPLHIVSKKIDGLIAENIWLVNGGFARLFVIPGSHESRILLLRADIPTLAYDYEMRGGVISRLEDEAVPLRPLLFEQGHEACGDLLDLIPRIRVRTGTHRVKAPQYRSEIERALVCRGGSFPGEIESQHIVPLLGKSWNNQLVYPDLMPADIFLKAQFETRCTIGNYKKWILQLLAAVKYLHSRSIIHCALRLENIFFWSETEDLAVGLGPRLGQLWIPEIRFEEPSNRPWSVKSDIYDIGCLIKSFIYGARAPTAQIESIWDTPLPFDRVVAWCTQIVPTSRPTLEQLRIMVEAIPDPVDFERSYRVPGLKLEPE